MAPNLSTNPKNQDPKTILPLTFQDLPEGRFNTGMVDVFAEPGGVKLCLTGWCCPCVVVGMNNDANGGYMGFWGGCLSFFVPFLNLFCVWSNGHQTAEKAGFQPEFIKSILKTLCCGCFYNCQIRRQQETLGLKEGQIAMCKQGAPGANYESTQPILQGEAV